MQLTISSLLFLFIPLFFNGSDKTVPVLSMQQLQERIVQPGSDTLYVVNFWATWCRPCIEEMPLFIQAEKKFSEKKLKIIFVSLDFASESERLAQFVKRKELKDVYQMNSEDPNNWINKIDTEWSGAIPATVFYRSGKKSYFREGEFFGSELDSLIQIKLQ